MAYKNKDTRQFEHAYHTWSEGRRRDLAQVFGSVEEAPSDWGRRYQVQARRELQVGDKCLIIAYIANGIGAGMSPITIEANVTKMFSKVVEVVFEHRGTSHHARFVLVDGRHSSSRGIPNDTQLGRLYKYAQVGQELHTLYEKALHRDLTAHYGNLAKRSTLIHDIYCLLRTMTNPQLQDVFSLVRAVIEGEDYTIG